MSPWWKRPEPVAPSIIEQVEPVEVPPITEAKRRFAKGDWAGALLVSYPTAANDLARAFKIPFPPGMTHEEFLRSQTTAEMGHLPEFFQRFYALYAPLRYGPPGLVADARDLPGIMKSIYAHRQMWYLYIQPKSPEDEQMMAANAASSEGAPPPAEEMTPTAEETTE